MGAAFGGRTYLLITFLAFNERQLLTSRLLDSENFDEDQNNKSYSRHNEKGREDREVSNHSHGSLVK